MPLEIRQWPLSAAKRSPQRRIPNSELAFSVDSPDEGRAKEEVDCVSYTARVSAAFERDRRVGRKRLACSDVKGRLSQGVLPGDQP